MNRSTAWMARGKCNLQKIRNEKQPVTIPVEMIGNDRPSPRSHREPVLKGALEYCLAALLLVLAAPVIAIAALVVRLTSHGPAFYSQLRVGKRGKLYWIYKIRTMMHNCESLTGPRWSIPGDPRVTAVGQFLRTTHIDELPQLLNVLRGEMSLVGPRPERPEFVTELARAVDGYLERIVVKPGITGLAQLRVPPDTDLDSVRHKLAYDQLYIRQQSLWLDLRIIVCTAWKAMKLPLRWGCRCLGIPHLHLPSGERRRFPGCRLERQAA